MSLRSSSSSSKNASSSSRSALARFAALPRFERRLVLAAAALMPVATLGVRLFGLGYALEVLRRRSVVAPARLEVRPVRLGALVNAAADRLPFTSSCLERSVAVMWLLGRRGHRSALVIEAPLGLRPFQAHAWVDTAEGPIGQSQGPAAEIARWPVPRSTAS